jgi:hypothetical protein
MKETMLKKSFKQEDVQRLRNLIQGKGNDKSKTIVGYSKVNVVHNEGESWEENGKTWVIKNGIKQNITKLDKAKQLINLPLFCPECNKLMKPHLDKKWFRMYKRCYNCQIDFEYNIRSQGLWDEYEKFIINSDIDFIIEDFEIWINEEINSESSFFSEAGDKENWVGSIKNKLLESKTETINYLKSLKK